MTTVFEAISVSVNKNTLPENDKHRNVSFQIANSGAGMQFLLMDCRARACAKGIFLSQTPVESDGRGLREAGHRQPGNDEDSFAAATGRFEKDICGPGAGRNPDKYTLERLQRSPALTSGGCRVSFCINFIFMFFFFVFLFFYFIFYRSHRPVVCLPALGLSAVWLSFVDCLSFVLFIMQPVQGFQLVRPIREVRVGSIRGLDPSRLLFLRGEIPTCKGKPPEIPRPGESHRANSHHLSTNLSRELANVIADFHFNVEVKTRNCILQDLLFFSF